MGDRLLDNSSRGAFDGSFKVTGDNKGRSPRSTICEPVCVCVCASVGESGTTKSVVDFSWAGEWGKVWWDHSIQFFFKGDGKSEHYATGCQL